MTSTPPRPLVLEDVASAPGQGGSRSLHRQLLLWLVFPQLVLWMAGGLGAYKLADGHANRAIDAGLSQASRALARQLKPLGSGLLIDFPRAAQDILESDPNDRVYYMVSSPPGSFLLGNNRIPAAPPVMVAQGKVGLPYFYDATMPPSPDGAHPAQQVRVAALLQIYGDEERPDMLMVQVARSRTSREALARSILTDMLLPMSVLVLAMTMIIWAGIRAGLAPLARLRREVEGRAPSDLKPIRLDSSPPELRSLVNAINELLAAVEGNLTTQKRFINDAAHQLRTPLAGLKGQTELALLSATEASQRERLKRVHASAARSAHLVGQLLTLARAEPESNAAQARTQVDMNQLARDATARLVPRALRAGVDLGLEDTPDDAGTSAPVTVHANGDLLHEALANLIDNAILYAGHGALITVAVRRAGEEAVLEVLDDGPGIAAADLPHVFERFVRATDLGNGCGLGLSIVREIVERHAGRVSLEAVAPRGLRAIIRLPLSRALPPTEEGEVMRYAPAKTASAA